MDQIQEWLTVAKSVLDIFRGVRAELPKGPMPYFHKYLEPEAIETPQYALIPPMHTIRNHHNGFPKYAYTAPMMETLGQALLDIQRDLTGFMKALQPLPHDPPEVP